jgi:hypothetical protein
VCGMSRKQIDDSDRRCPGRQGSEPDRGQLPIDPD